MTTRVYIENVLGSGQVVRLTEAFGDYSVARDLRPGEYVRIALTPLKTLSVEEVPIHGAAAIAAANDPRRHAASFPAPRATVRRYG